MRGNGITTHGLHASAVRSEDSDDTILITIAADNGLVTFRATKPSAARLAARIVEALADVRTNEWERAWADQIEKTEPAVV